MSTPIQSDSAACATLDEKQAAALAVLADPRQVAALAAARGVPEETVKAELTAVVAPESLPFDQLPPDLQVEYVRNGKAIGMVKRDIAQYMARRYPPPISLNSDSNWTSGEVAK